MNASNFTNQVVEKLPAGYRLIYLSLYGSNLYGTALPTSDTDYRGIFIPSMEDLLLGKAEKKIYSFQPEIKELKIQVKM